ncbi:MAG: 6,7-dimethyl-8-ribityllumazine synthase [Dehalococcoidia bacterium]|nr:6,7-dimethyl-8-ribityllumazine synthase [Dehalococcoidia bacterium]
MAEFSGATEGRGLRIAIVVARWNGFITEQLLEGAQRTLAERGVTGDAVPVIRVPGSFEVPAAAQWAAASGKVDAVICLGAVIRGETAHFEYVAGAAQQGCLNVTRDTGVPAVFGVLTVDTTEQALERTGGKEGHKGEESAATAIEMANLRRQLAEGL